MKFKDQLKAGVILDNPIFMQTIGLCPTLATSTSLSNAIGMGVAATVVLICSNIVISALRRFIPDKVRIAAFITIIAAFVTTIDLALQAFVPSLASSLGLFLPLIVVNCIILGRAEAYASKNAVLPSALDGVCMGLGFTFALVLTAEHAEVSDGYDLYGHALFVHALECTLRRVRGSLKDLLACAVKDADAVAAGILAGRPGELKAPVTEIG